MGTVVRIKSEGAYFSIHGPDWRVSGTYKEAALQALKQLGVEPLPDPRAKKTNDTEDEKKD